jgi:hypothetical protein
MRRRIHACHMRKRIHAMVEYVAAPVAYELSEVRSIRT